MKQKIDIMNENKEINFLLKLDNKNWFDLFDSIFQNKTLPHPFQYRKDYPTELLLYLNNFIFSNIDINQSKTFQNNLINYYLGLPKTPSSYEIIYLLHRVFSKIQIRENTKYLFKQLYTNFFINNYYNKDDNEVLLQTSLLSALIELPDIKAYNLSTYLLNTIGKTDNIAFYRVSFRYFSKEKTINEFYNYFNQFIIIYQINHNNENEIADMLVEAIMDYRYYNGSFEDLFDFIDNDNFWINIYHYNKPLIKSISNILNNKYLKPGKKWYDNDIFAKLFKIYINSIKSPPPPNLLENIIKELENISQFKPIFESRIEKFSKLQNYWTEFTYEIIDEERDDQYIKEDYYFNEIRIEKIQPKNIIQEQIWFIDDNMNNDNNDLIQLINFYKNIYSGEYQNIATKLRNPSPIFVNLFSNKTNVPDFVLDLEVNHKL